MKPNVLFILLDGCRADKFLEKENSKPHINKMIKQGVYFSQAISCTDYTMTSINSMITGRYPFGAGESKTSYEKMISNVPNYIDHFKGYGYHAYATMFSAIHLMGFSKYFENDDQSYEVKTRLFNGLGEKILKNLSSNNLFEPWIYYVHILDLHRPILVPDKFSKESTQNRYDLVLRIIDEWLGKFLEKIDLEKTLVIVTADHGDYIPVIDDSLKNEDTIYNKSKKFLKKLIPDSKRESIHSIKSNFKRKLIATKLKTRYEKHSLNLRPDQERYQFEELIRIPLLFIGYNIKPTNSINEPVRSIDIFPTINEIIGLHPLKEKIDGRSLLPLLMKQKLEKLPIYMESTTIHTIAEEPIAVVGVRTEEFKYFRSLQNPSENVHLYDLKNDPLENENLVNKMPDKMKEMEELLIKIRENKQESPQFEKIDDNEVDKVEDELKKLGYM